MSEQVGAVFIGLAALAAIAVMFFVARRVLTGSVIPIEVDQLRIAQEEHIAELKAMNAALQEERATVQAQLRQLVKDSTEANFAIHAWLTRYEALGGFAISGPTIGPRSGEQPHRPGE